LRPSRSVFPSCCCLSLSSLDFYSLCSLSTALKCSSYCIL
jgi:hypothetical protein